MDKRLGESYCQQLLLGVLGVVAEHCLTIAELGDSFCSWNASDLMTSTSTVLLLEQWRLSLIFILRVQEIILEDEGVTARV